MSWCGYKEKREQSGAQAGDSKSAAKIEKAVWPSEAKAQPGDAPTERKGTATGEEKQRDIRRTFKMLREVWLNIGVEKMDSHKGVTVKVLLDSGTTGVFMNRKMAERNSFKLEKLERLLIVKNVDGTVKSGGAIMHQIECNVYYKGYMERIRIDVCSLGKTDMILDIPWL